MREVLRRARTVLVGHPVACLVVGSLLLLSLVWSMIPESVATRDARIDNELAQGRVTEIAKAPDGARVWAVQRGRDVIYFSHGSVAVRQPDPSGGS